MSLLQIEFRRKQITYVLDSATENLCNNLDPANILQRLKTRRVLTGDDVLEITSFPRCDNQVDRLLEILKRSHPESYDEFMAALFEFRSDLYDDVKAIESAYSGKTFKLQYLQS